MWNLIFLIIAGVAFLTLIDFGLKAQVALTQLHKSFPNVNEKFIKEQRNFIKLLMLIGVALGGMMITINIPNFVVKYSVLDGVTIIGGSIAYTVAAYALMN